MPTCEVIEGSQILLTNCSEKEKALARGIQCRTWSRKDQGWLFPIRAEVLKELRATLQVQIPPEAESLAREIESRENSVKEAKLQGWEKAEVTEPMPLKNATPFQHQKLAYELSCQLLGVFN